MVYLKDNYNRFVRVTIVLVCVLVIAKSYAANRSVDLQDYTYVIGKSNVNQVDAAA